MAERTHLAFFAELVAEAEPYLTGSEQLAWFTLLELEHANLRVALETAIYRDPIRALRMAGELGRFWDHHSHVTEGIRWLDTACQGESLPPALLSKATWSAGVLEIVRGRYERAHELLTQAVDTARIAGDDYLLGFALNGLGSVAIHTGDIAAAHALHRQAVEALTRAGDIDGIAAALGNVGFTALVRGDTDIAVARLTESLALYRQLESMHGIASIGGTLGRALVEAGAYGDAYTCLSESLQMSQQLGNKWYLVAALEGLAALAACQGQPQRASQIYQSIDRLVADEGIALHPFDLALRARHVSVLQHDQQPYDAARSGSNTSGEPDVIAYALLTDETGRALGLRGPAIDQRLAGLTNREREVLQLLIDGLTDREIASRLDVGIRTVNFHVSNILGKLELDSRTQAATFVLREGML